MKTIIIPLPVSMSKKDITQILNHLNHLGVSHHIMDDIWYDRSIELYLNSSVEQCHLLIGIRIGKLLNHH